MEIIDLTYKMEEGMLTFNAPWHPKVKITQIGHIEREGRETREVVFGTHTGTHIDAPLHFIKNGLTIDKTPLSSLIGPVTIIDLSHFKDNDMVTKEMLTNLQITDRILFKFGWGEHWPTKKFYEGWPYFSESAIKYLISKKIKMLAMDTPSPDDSCIKLSGKNLGSLQDSPMHKLLLGSGIAIVEYVANLNNVKDYDGWNIAALPLKLGGCDASPARVCIFR